MQAIIVVDLGFGDAGKGLITDFLVRQKKAGLVVRYNGGAQAGHNVVAPDGRHHTFSQFGSGTFVPGVKTYLSKHVVIHPTALLLEGDVLIKKGVNDAFFRLRVSEQCLVISPFHQAANRIHEIMRADARHGSCGVGVGEVVEDAQAQTGDSIRAGDLANLPILRKKLRSINERKRIQLVDLYGERPLKQLASGEWEFFKSEDVVEAWIASISRINDFDLVVSDEVLEKWFHQTDTVVFEGAQGVLLDAEIGFHPYTSWTRSTTANALDLLAGLAPDSEVSTIGVTRCYSVRHGPGPLPTQTEVLSPIITEHNCRNDWQGVVRYGWFDSVLCRYALCETGGVDALAVTHMDLLPRLKTWKYSVSYKIDNPANLFFKSDDPTGIISEINSQKSLPLEGRTKFMQALLEANPVYETCVADAKVVIGKIEELTGRPVELIVQGSSSNDVKLIKENLTC